MAASSTPLCATAFLFGIPCPGCGLTRATLALLHGDFSAALRFHPLSPVLAPLFAAALGKVLVDYVRGPGRALGVPSWWAGRTVTALGGVLFVALIGVWGARLAGYLGGPVPVESYATWLARQAGADADRPARPPLARR